MLQTNSDRTETNITKKSVKKIFKKKSTKKKGRNIFWSKNKILTIDYETIDSDMSDTFRGVPPAADQSVRSGIDIIFRIIEEK